MSRKLTSEEVQLIKTCVKENRSLTFIMAKTKLKRISILNAMKKHMNISVGQAKFLGTSEFKNNIFL